MQGGRWPIGGRRRPHVVFSKGFPEIKNLELGDSGQIDGVVIVEGISLEPDDDGTEYKHIDMKVTKAKILTRTEARM